MYGASLAFAQIRTDFGFIVLSLVTPTASSNHVSGLYLSIGINFTPTGAGRLMSRTEAVRSLSLKDEVARLEAQGIIHAIRGQSDLEEAAGAYKDIDKVMADQSDLVKIVTELVPVAVIKG